MVSNFIDLLICSCHLLYLIVWLDFSYLLLNNFRVAMVKWNSRFYLLLAHNLHFVLLDYECIGSKFATTSKNVARYGC